MGRPDRIRGGSDSRVSWCDCAISGGVKCGGGIVRIIVIGAVWSCSIVDGNILAASSSMLTILGTSLLIIVSGRWSRSGVVGGVGLPEVC